MDSIDIIEVLGDFITLKKKGQNYWACCPFHNEKSPSFSVSSQKQIYKCFGCGKAGDAVKFVRDHEGLNYGEALKYLASKYNIVVEDEEVTEETKDNQNKKDALYIVLNYAKTYYNQTLKTNDEGKSVGLSYFRERGFSDNIIEEFELGYSLDSWEAFTKDALSKGYSKEFLVETGLAHQKENGDLIDIYRGRVMFPIHNLVGKVVGFGGRTLKNDKKEAKYINTKETEVYSKRNVLYGAFQAKNHIRNADECLLVEGYTDVLSLHQGGVNNVVASSGTSLTEEQVRLVRRYTSNITFLFDGDAAGQKAALRGLDLVLAEGMNISVVVFPETEDPDSYIRKVGATAFKEYISSKKEDFISFKIKVFLHEAQDDPIKKSHAVKEIIQSLAKIKDKITREIFCKKASGMLDINEATILSETNKLLVKEHQDKKKQDQSDVIDELSHLDQTISIPQEEDLSKEDVLHIQEKELVKYLLRYSNQNVISGDNLATYLLQNIGDVEIKNKTCSFVINEYKKALESDELLSPNYFFKFEDEAVRSLVVDLTMERYQLDDWNKFDIVVPKEEDNLDENLFKCLLFLKWKNLRLMIMEHDEKFKTMSEPKEVDTALKIKMHYKQLEQEIAGKFGNVISF